MPHIISHPLAPYLALWYTPGIGPRRFYKLVTHFSDIQQLFRASTPQLTALGMPEATIHALQNPNWRSVEHTLTWATQPNNHILTWEDAHYPSLLKEIHDPPPILLVKGSLQPLNTTQIAIVGSRNPTYAGLEITRTFTRDLVVAGLTITSGLALGIDAASHQSALDHQGVTIGVLGTGIDKIYPLRHKKLAERMVAEGSTIISEFPLGTAPKAENFPRRNRIISGLSLGTVVIEATQKSGSLITARLAAEQGRDVFAIPGSIHNVQAQGCHLLIQQGAKLTQTPQEILEELRVPYRSCQPPEIETAPLTTQNSLDAPSQLLLECIGSSAISVDQLVERTNLPAHIVSSVALQLELQGFIGSTLGGYVKLPKRK